MSASQANVVPFNLRDNEIRSEIPHNPKLKKMIETAHADLEGNVRMFLEDHCGIAGARNLNTPIADLKLRMQLADIAVAHISVTLKPEMDGIWIIQGNKPLVAFTDPRFCEGKVVIKKIILDHSAYVIPQA